MVSNKIVVPEEGKDMNTLYYGDNLNILREHIKDESIDLIYLDPPFNSKATYLDPFCGCGTSISSAQSLKRKWIGIDITHLAINLIERRIKTSFPRSKFDVLGIPKDLDGAIELSKRDKYEFQWWATSLIDAIPFDGRKKGADGGIDGLLYFRPETKVERAIVSVKGGHVDVSQIRDLVGTLRKNNAPAGIFVTLNKPTKPMIKDAASAGFNDSYYGKYPCIQILTIEEILDGKHPDLPMIDMSDAFKRSPLVRVDKLKQDSLFDKRK
ncbi:MAG: restriction endonuclease [Candidatus Hatepunaea meridiana]|nr:restriction endonuclease [Candidatus Hatepunaea meridiana]